MLSMTTKRSSVSARRPPGGPRRSCYSTAIAHIRPGRRRATRSRATSRTFAPRRARAARALGELRDTRSLDLLVDLLAAHEDILVQSAHIALVILTRQDFGQARGRWVEWMDANAGRHRIEWLIDALLHPDEALRTAAADELKHVTQEYYGFHPRLPKHDREIMQKKYRRWWDTEGHRRFKMPS